jgi:penicillin amidase
MSHLLRLPGFSVAGVAIQGGAGTMNPSSAGPYGSSWRMVVELGPTVTAMGTYPGGQSGNPASVRYDDRIPYWREGKLDTLFTPAAPEDLKGAAVRATLTLRPAEGKR